MNTDISDFLDKRIGQINQQLCATDDGYAESTVNQAKRYAQLESGILRFNHPITIDELDLDTLKVFLEYQIDLHAISQQHVYMQGMKDCVAVLKLLTIL